jgi:hypothetical protein
MYLFNHLLLFLRMQTRLCKSIWQADVAMRVTRAPLDGAAAGKPQLAVV